jgi:hypothetical protein
MYGYATAEAPEPHLSFLARKASGDARPDGAMERIASGVQSFLAKHNRSDAATD